MAAIAFLLCLWLVMCRQTQAQELRNSAPTNLPVARVVIVQDSEAINDLKPIPDYVQMMVERGITNLTGKTDLIAAWKTLVSTNDIVGIKVLSAPGPVSGTRRAVVTAVVQDLLKMGVPARHILVWDRRALDLRMAGYFELQRRFGIQVRSSVESGYDTNRFYERPLLGQLAADDVDFDKKGPGIGRKSYVSKLITKEVTKIINITPMLHHNEVGVSGNLFSLALGSVDNVGRFEGKAEDLSQAIPEIWALPVKSEDDRLSDHVVLNIVDALICQYEGQEHGLLHYSTVLDQLRFSKDPVALDVLSLQEINFQREHAAEQLNKLDISLFSNASLLELGVSDTNRIRVEKIQ